MIRSKSSNEKAGIYIILFMVFLLILIIILYILGVLGKNRPSADIIVDNTVMFTYSKKKWSEVNSRDYSNYNWNKYLVYADKKKLGNYSIYSYDGKFYVFDVGKDSRTPVNVVGDSISVGGKIDTEVLKFKRSSLNNDDIKYVHKVLDYYKIDRENQNKYTYRYKISYDFDNDKKNEDMFIISNMFSDSDVDNSYSFIFIRDNGNTKMIYNKIYGNNKNLSGCYAYLFDLIKVKNSKAPQIITKCSHYSVSIRNEFGLYQYNNKNYELLIYSR